MTRERYSLTVRLRGRIFISSIVYFSWTAARGWRMIFPLSLSFPLAFFPPRLFFPPSGGKHRPVDDAERSAVRGDTRFSSAMGCARRSDDHLSTPLDSYRFLGDKLHYGIIEEGYSGRGGKESNREMMFANRLTTAQRRFMLLGRFANREIGK